jgi:hypothetical protein
VGRSLRVIGVLAIVTLTMLAASSMVLSRGTTFARRADSYRWMGQPGTDTATATPTVTPTLATSAPLPDLVISNSRSGREWNGRCWDNGPHDAWLDVEVSNQGSSPAGRFVVRTEPLDDVFWEVAGLAAGEQLWLHRFPGHADVVMADADGEVVESDETNNRRTLEATPALTQPVTCTPEPSATAPPGSRPDLVIDEVALAYTDTWRPCDVPSAPNTRLRVANRGLVPAGHFVVRTDPTGEIFADVPELAAQTSSWLPPRPGWPSAARIDADGEVDESDETNNHVVITPLPVPTWAPECTRTPTASATPSATPTPRPVWLPRSER